MKTPQTKEGYPRWPGEVISNLAHHSGRTLFPDGTRSAMPTATDYTTLVEQSLASPNDEMDSFLKKYTENKRNELATFRERVAGGTFKPLWSEYGEFTVTMANGRTVSCVYEPWGDTGSLILYGPINECGYHHHFGRQDDVSLKQYALEQAEIARSDCEQRYLARCEAHGVDPIAEPWEPPAHAKEPPPKPRDGSIGKKVGKKDPAVLKRASEAMSSPNPLDAADPPPPKPRDAAPAQTQPVPAVTPKPRGRTIAKL